MPRSKQKRHFEKVIDDRYVIEKLLGEGGFCVVFKALSLSTNENVAIKRMDKTKPLYRKFQNPRAMSKLNDLMYREADIMRSLNHENIMRLLDFIDDGMHIYLVMEYAEGGELYSRLQKMRRFTENATMVIIRQVVNGIHFMHINGFVHRDIKAENILFRYKQSSSIIITDFGLSKESDGLLFTNCGTLVYSAPELLLHKENKRGYDKMVDNWAIGVLTYLLLCGHLPFDDVQQNDKRITKKILKAKVNFPFSEWGNITQNAKDFVLKFLDYDPLQRMKLDEALEHSFLNNLKIDSTRTHKDIHMMTDTANTQQVYSYPMMEATHLQVLAKIRWQVVICFCLTIMQLNAYNKSS